MGSSPIWKVYTQNKEYVAACKYADDAAVLVSAYGDGSQVRYNHKLLVWDEGDEINGAGESYDKAAAIMQERVRTRKGSNA